MTKRVTKSAPTPLLSSMTTATEILSDYEQWLLTHYGTIGTYRDHAKSFLKRFRDKGSIFSQLDTFAAKKSITGRSILNRFRKFLAEKNVISVSNDLKTTWYSKLPKGNAYVKLYMANSSDRLRSEKTLSTYATILNHYFVRIGELRHFQKFTAEQFIFQRGLSPFTSSLYATVLKSFSNWALSYKIANDHDLSRQEQMIKQALHEISIKSLQDIVRIKVKTTERKLYFKESLSEKQRERLMNSCKDFYERSVIALMAYNGLRPVEIERLSVEDINFRKFTIAIHGKGRDVRHKEIIVLFRIVALSLRPYLKERRSKRGKLFPNLSYKSLHELVLRLFKEIRLPMNGDISFSPHSLRHTAGQLLYDDGIPLEFIQRTLRHTSMESTLVYARKAIERSYFKRMRHHW